jgi:hypothetical protein
MAEVEGKWLRRCERCGQQIIGTRARRYCGPEENPACWRNRRKADQQRLRRKWHAEKDSCANCEDSIAVEVCCGQVWGRQCYQEHCEEMGRRGHRMPS